MIILERTKVYKPEINNCPLCGSKLKYRYTVSNKTIQFTSGKYIRVKNLGYSCSNDECLDNKVIYCSQTASKLCIKGYTYSSKVLAFIVVMKHIGLSREQICDKLAFMGVEISDRNVDIINEKYEKILHMDYKKNIEIEYNYMKNHYGQIRLSIDNLIVDNIRVLSIRDSFNNHQIGLHFINIEDMNTLTDVLKEYVSDEKLSTITTVGKKTNFFKILESIVDRKIEYIHFLKY